MAGIGRGVIYVNPEQWTQLNELADHLRISRAEVGRMTIILGLAALRTSPSTEKAPEVVQSPKSSPESVLEPIVVDEDLSDLGMGEASIALNPYEGY